MKRCFWVWTTFLSMVVAGLSGCGTISGTAENLSPDAQIASDVRARLTSDPQVGRCNIGVSVSGGVVTLNGSVPDATLRLRAKAAARDAEGVKGVVDNLNSR